MKKFNLIDLENNLEILNSIPDWVKITSVLGVVIFGNKSLINELKFDPQGIRISDLKSTKFHDIFKSLPSLESFSGRDFVKSEIQIDGKFYDVVTAPIRDIMGNITAFVDVYRNITAQKYLEFELTFKNEIMNKDLRLTKKIQNSILPVVSKVGQLNIQYMYIPCEHASGDIFDVVNISEDITSVYICDVSGHGVPAAMITVFVRETMRNLEEYYSSSIALRELQRRFLNLRLELEQYLTIFYILIDTKEKTISYSNAGHNCPMLFIKNNDVKRVYLSGKPITGYFKDTNYKEEIMSFEPGDKILLFTDGIPEARNLEGDEYGIERIESIIKRKPDNILPFLKKSVDLYCRGQRFDDMSAILIEYEV